MIISKDINPERDFYFLGAKIIEVLSNSEDKKHDFFTVYEKMKSMEPISINLFTLSLDWLFIIGAVSKSEKGDIIKCF